MLSIPDSALRTECFCNLLCIGAGIAVIAWCIATARDLIRDMLNDWREGR